MWKAKVVWRTVDVRWSMKRGGEWGWRKEGEGWGSYGEGWRKGEHENGEWI